MSLNDKKMMLIGAKESFVIRALEKKLDEAKIAHFFMVADPEKVCDEWSNAAIITYYIDQSDKVDTVFLNFLNEKLTENDIQVIIIGEKIDTDVVCNNLPIGRILKVFQRPLNMDEFINTAKTEMKALKDPPKKSILVVDDDATYVGLVRDWLKEKYKVSMAISGLQAISLLATTHVDLILLDYEMPITNGPQVLEMLRNDPMTRHVPVIFLTGKSDKESVMKVVGLKPEGYLLKSISREELMADLQKFFATRK
ncbi:PleD family two-component system response regulator [Butyrivibrio sp. JL13D10]|uniref:response regulator n=1 Tax=Butyrivibrio sp. JL13D10 TaxID=3236815 RepID=UPI0038B65673